MNKKTILNFPLSVGAYSLFVNQILDIAKKRVSASVCVANVHMVVEAHQDKEFSKVIRKADIVTPDGKPLVWALRLLAGLKQDRVAGMDLLPALLDAMVKNKLSAYFYGGSENLLSRTKDYLKKAFETLNIAGLYSPPYRNLNEEEEEEVVRTINESNANIVFVVLGCPKQEKWMNAMKGKINAVMIGIGGALPVMIGMQKRAPVWMQNMGLEWFFRLCQEPRRLFRRYAITNTIFLYLFTKEIIKNHLYKRTRKDIIKPFTENLETDLIKKQELKPVIPATPGVVSSLNEF